MAAANPDAAAGSEVLDLCSSQLHNLDGVTILSELKVLDLTANRLTQIDPRILALTGLVSVNFRQNLLPDVSAWSDAACKGSLEDLEFRDNQLTAIPELPGFSRLRRLEFSYNEIKNLAPLSALTDSSGTLEELYVAANKVAAVPPAISQLTALTTLELGSNRLRVIENLSGLTLLRDLWLGRNRITAISGLEALKNLRRISIQSNRLESMLGLESCAGLEELYLSHNGINKLEGLGPLVNLRVLDVSNNRISKVEGLETLTQLEDLWLNDNAVPALDDQLAAALAPLAATLTTIYLENNPAAKQPEYKAKLLAWLPKLQQLDADVL